MEIQITRANTKYDNAVKEVNRLKSLNTELFRAIDRLSIDANRYQYIRNNQTWYRFNDNSFVGCKFPYDFNFSAPIMLDHNLDKLIKSQHEVKS